MQTNVEIKPNGTRNFANYPGLGDLLRRSNEQEDSGAAGMPGFEYLITSLNASHYAREDDWEQINGMLSFEIVGHPCTLLARGKALPGLSIGDIKCPVYYDGALEELTGLPLGEAVNKVESTETLAPAKSSKSGSQTGNDTVAAPAAPAGA